MCRAGFFLWGLSAAPWINHRRHPRPPCAQGATAGAVASIGGPESPGSADDVEPRRNLQVPVHDEGAGQVLAARGAGAAPAEEVQAVGERGQGDLLSRVERPRADTLAEQATRTLDTGAAVGFELVGGDEELLPRVEADGYRLVPVHGQRAGAGPAGAGAGAAPGDDAGAGAGRRGQADRLAGVVGDAAGTWAVEAARAGDPAVARYRHRQPWPGRPEGGRDGAVPRHRHRAGGAARGTGTGTAPAELHVAGAGGGVEDDALPGVEGRGARARAVDAAGATDDAVGR